MCMIKNVTAAACFAVALSPAFSQTNHWEKAGYDGLQYTLKSFTIQEATTKIVKLSADPLPVYKIPFQPASISFTIKAPDPLDNNL